MIQLAQLQPAPIAFAKKLSQNAIPVGTFSTNLPVTPQNRKAGACQDKDCRRAGAPASLSVRLENVVQGYKIMWRDTKGFALNGDLIRLKNGLNIGMTVTQAIINWDQAERSRVESYNASLIVPWPGLALSALPQLAPIVLLLSHINFGPKGVP
ncbi:hypothetical protein FLONG3_3729 [Fusarium longipes]|uniref:Uncharacterized protein n=1 Tax=Fusarium longipes TaxID=694270 RepID=A0A395T0F8_9HYPO|nr:hypothetical protein FLONG3_3729 [Fusarium longipes]